MAFPPTPNPGHDLRNLTNEDYAYLAGLFDGEGCITLRIDKKGKANIRFQIIMTSGELLKTFHRKTGLGSLRSYSPKQSQNKQLFAWVVVCNQALQLCRSIRPWLKVKAAQVDLIFDFAAQEQLNTGRSGPKYRLTPERIEFRRDIAKQLSQLKLVS